MRNINEIANHYIGKNRETTAMIYLKENDRKAAQKLFCHAYAADCGYKALGDTTNIENIKDCDVLLIASASMLTRDMEEYIKIEKELKKKGIKIEIAIGGGRAERYLNAVLKLYKKGRI